MQCVINLGFGEKKIQMGMLRKLKLSRSFLLSWGGCLDKDTIGILWVEA